MADIYNETSNTLISGTSGYDSIENGYYYNGYGYGGENVTIKSDAGNDYIHNYGKNSLIDGGTGNDHIENYRGSDVTIIGGAGKDTVWSNGDNGIIDSGAGEDSVRCYGSNVSIDAGADNDYVSVTGANVTVDGGDGDDKIYRDVGGNFSSIFGGAGNDNIQNFASYVTIEGGKGDDSINAAGRNVLIEYRAEDGNDIITNFDSTDTLKIFADSYSTTKSGNDLIVTVGEGKITLSGSGLSSPNIELEETETNSWKLSGTTATYGTSSETLITVKGVKSVDGLSLKDKVVTVSKSSVNATKITISDGYTLKLGSDVTVPKSTNAWSLTDTTATLKQTTTAGYKLSNNAITYTKKATKTLATVNGVKSLDGLSLSGKVVTISKASLNNSKVTISDGYTLKLGNDVTAPTTKKAAWTLKNSTATYKSSYKTAGYTLASDSKSISYSKATTASKLATIKGVTSTDGLTLSGKTVKLAANSLATKVTVGGSYSYDFASDYKSATITGSKNSDTIAIRGTKISVNAGAGDDTIKIFGAGTVSGGDGADTFYFKSTGANVISDYAAEDKISIASGTAATSTSGNDLILTVGKGKITVNGGKNKVVTYYDADGEHIYKNTPDPIKGVKFNADGTGATLTAKYTADEFTPSEYSEYKDTLVTINAANVDYKIKIVGNKRANKITGTNEDDYIDGAEGRDKIYGGDGNDTLLGGDGNDSLSGGYDDDSLSGGAGSDTLEGGGGDDTLWGGDGNDTLFGGAGKDKFLYYDGDGDDVIADFNSSLDKIIVMEGLVEPGIASGDDVIFNVESGSIIVQGYAKKSVKIYNSKNTVVQNYKP